MGQNKIEKQIKEKLNSREIQPSAQAWDRLDAMLTLAEEKKTKRSFGWLYIAAGILVLVSLGLFLFNPKSTEINTNNEVVDANPVKDSLSKEQLQPQMPKNNGESVATSDSEPTSVKINTSNNSQSVSIINQKQSNKTQVKVNQQTVNQKPLINRNKEIEYQNSSDVALKDLPKVIERTPQIAAPKNSLSDEQLLAGLDKTAKETTNKPSTIKVDAKSLLTQVDGELEQTFREKVINKVRKNYKEVKVALANRNNE